MHERDGVAFMSQRAAEVASGAAVPVDLLFLDVFDGDDQVPVAFKEPGEDFITALLLLAVLQRVKPLCAFLRAVLKHRVSCKQDNFLPLRL